LRHATPGHLHPLAMVIKKLFAAMVFLVFCPWLAMSWETTAMEETPTAATPTKR